MLEQEKSKNKKRKLVVDPVAARSRRKRRNQILAIMLAVVLALGGVTLRRLSLQAKSEAMARAASLSVQQEVITTRAELGVIEETLTTGGTLVAAGETELEIPGSIKVSQYYVKAGDDVAAGDPIAVLDHDSVLAAIAENESLIASLDSAMAAIAEDAIESTVKASVDGTIVKIYGAKGDSVVDVMYENGALMLISLDDRLAIDIPNTGNVSIGDSFTIQDSRGKGHTGHVAGITRDTITITVELDEFSLQEQVTVKGKGEIRDCEGQLYIYSQQKITGNSGTISKVNKKEGASVTVGETLLTLSNTDYTADYLTLLNRRNQLVEQYNTLVHLAEDGRVYAGNTGIISELDTTLLTDQNSADLPVTAAGMKWIPDGSQAHRAVPMAFIRVMSMEVPEEAGKASGEKEPFGGETPSGVEDASGEEEPSGGEGTAGGEDHPGGEKPDDGGEHTGGNPPSEGEEKPGEEETTVVDKKLMIQWMDAQGKPVTQGIPESYEITLNADGRKVGTAEVKATEQWTYVFEKLPVKNGSVTISYTVACDLPTGYTAKFQVRGDTMTLIFTQSGINSDDRGGGGSFGGGNFRRSSRSGGSFSAFFGTGGSGSANGKADGSDGRIHADDYTQSVTKMGTIIPDDKISMEIVIDELDIRQIASGDAVQVRLDALPGRSFPGIIAGVDLTGTNNGGHTKYLATVTMEKTEDMLLGMNAAITIPGKMRTDVLTVPAAALVEQGGKTYVYTAYDEKKDTLIDPVPVVTGASDGEKVEIRSGLEEGAQICYKYADSLTFHSGGSV